MKCDRLEDSFLGRATAMLITYFRNGSRISCGCGIVIVDTLYVRTLHTYVHMYVPYDMVASTTLLCRDFDCWI